MSTQDRRDRLRAQTGEAARRAGETSAEAAPAAPAAGDLYVLSASADLPVEWLLLGRADDDPDGWLAVPVDTNPLRGPGDLAVGPDEAGGPLTIRCRFGVRLPGRLLAGGAPSGRLGAEATAHALGTVHDHERGTLDPGPLAEEVAADPEYQDWERDVLRPAREAVAAPASRGVARPVAVPWIAAAAALALLSVGLGAWNLTLRERLGRLAEPSLIGGSLEVVVGPDARAPDPLRVRAGDERLLVFIVLSDEAADHERYRVELADADDATLWASPEVERGPVPELTLVIPGRFLDGPRTPDHLVVLGIDGESARELAEIPIQIEPTEGAP